MWSDAESEVDYLNFSEVAESIADIVCEPKLLPISIGVFGDWGAGKSTILNLTKNILNNRDPNYVHITFDAWLFQGYDDARASLLETISNHILSITTESDTWFDKAKSFAKRINIIRGLGVTADVGLSFAGLPTFGAVSLLVGKLNSGESIQDMLRDKEGIIKGINEINQLIKPSTEKTAPKEIQEFRKEYEELIEAIGKPIVIYIDNLDRCTPQNTIQTLEAIRLFLFIRNTAFIIATDEDMVRAAVQEYHKGSTERHQTDYLDKLIQVPIYVPKPGVLETRAYLFMLLLSLEDELTEEELYQIRQTIEDSLKMAWKEEPIKINQFLSEIEDSLIKEKIEQKLKNFDYMSTMLATSAKIQGNPRIVKRLLNTAAMRKKVSERRMMNLDESLILKFIIFERCLDMNEVNYLYQMIDQENGKPKFLHDLEENLDGIVWPDELSKDSTKIFIQSWVNLEPKLKNQDLRTIAYLSKETVPLGVIGKSLSDNAQELFMVLLDMKGRSSARADNLLKNTNKLEYPLIMEELIHKYREIINMSDLIAKINGALLLAKHCNTAKESIILYLNNLSNQSVALKEIIKELTGARK